MAQPVVDSSATSLYPESVFRLLQRKDRDNATANEVNRNSASSSGCYDLFDSWILLEFFRGEGMSCGCKCEESVHIAELIRTVIWREYE